MIELSKYFSYVGYLDYIIKKDEGKVKSVIINFKDESESGLVDTAYSSIDTTVHIKNINRVPGSVKKITYENADIKSSEDFTVKAKDIRHGYDIELVLDKNCEAEVVYAKDGATINAVVNSDGEINTFLSNMTVCEFGKDDDIQMMVIGDYFTMNASDVVVLNDRNSVLGFCNDPNVQHVKNLLYNPKHIVYKIGGETYDYKLRYDMYGVCCDIYRGSSDQRWCRYEHVSTPSKAYSLSLHPVFVDYFNYNMMDGHLKYWVLEDIQCERGFTEYRRTYLKLENDNIDDLLADLNSDEDNLVLDESLERFMEKKNRLYLIKCDCCKSNIPIYLKDEPKKDIKSVHGSKMFGCQIRRTAMKTICTHCNHEQVFYITTEDNEVVDVSNN